MSQALTSDAANNTEAAYSLAKQPRNKRLAQLMLATSLGVALSIPAIFLVPVWPLVVPVVSLFLIITGLCLWLLRSWVHQSLAIPEQDEKLLYRWPWQFSSRDRIFKRKYILVLLWLAAYLFTIGTFNVLLTWFTRTRDWDSFSSSFPLIITGVFSYIIFALVWRHEGKPIDRGLNRPLGTGLVTLCVVAVGALGLWQIPKQIASLKVGPAKSWAEQWAAAQNAISAKYPDTVLTSLRASRDYDAPNSYDASLYLNFSFVNQLDGAEPDVALRDSNPEASIQIFGPYEPFDKLDVYTSDNEAKLKALLATIRLSPRDALQKTLADIERDTPGATAPPDRFPQIELDLTEFRHFEKTTFDSLNKPAAWDIRLTTQSDSRHLEYWIDAQNGDILLKQVNK